MQTAEDCKRYIIEQLAREELALSDVYDWQLNYEEDEEQGGPCVCVTYECDSGDCNLVTFDWFEGAAAFSSNREEYERYFSEAPSLARH